MSQARLVITAVVVAKGLGVREIARTYNMSPGWVSGLVTRCRAKLHWSHECPRQGLWLLRQPPRRSQMVDCIAGDGRGTHLVRSSVASDEPSRYRSQTASSFQERDVGTRLSTSTAPTQPTVAVPAATDWKAATRGMLQLHK
jgi:hypothetical protein